MNSAAIWSSYKIPTRKVDTNQRSETWPVQSENTSIQYPVSSMIFKYWSISISAQSEEYWLKYQYQYAEKTEVSVFSISILSEKILHLKGEKLVSQDCIE